MGFAASACARACPSPALPASDRAWTILAIGLGRVPQREHRRRLELVLRLQLVETFGAVVFQLTARRVAPAMAAEELAAREPQPVRPVPPLLVGACRLHGGRRLLVRLGELAERVVARLALLRRGVLLEIDGRLPAQAGETVCLVAAFDGGTDKCIGAVADDLDCGLDWLGNSSL